MLGTFRPKEADGSAEHSGEVDPEFGEALSTAEVVKIWPCFPGELHGGYLKMARLEWNIPKKKWMENGVAPIFFGHLHDWGFPKMAGGSPVVTG